MLSLKHYGSRGLYKVEMRFSLLIMSMELAKDHGLNTVLTKEHFGLKLKFPFQLPLKKRFAK
jgi:hypothetical protein